ncbi:hypothetical protein KAS08_02535 [Candidatus Pacearchaeota archaeon]|nr:hypothetical protein [Candidatus Pacearchaeota archaeon]
MASLHHHTIKKIINNLIKDYSQLDKIKTIKLNDPDSKGVIEYEPDYIIKRNISKHSYYFLVFEVIDGQSDIKTMADIARIIGKPEIRKAIFISCNKKKGEETDRIISALVGSYKSRFKKKRKDIIDISSRQILKSDTYEEVEKVILDELKSFLPKIKNNQ